MTDTAKSEKELVVVTDVKPPDVTLLESRTSTELNLLERNIPLHCKFKTPVLLRKGETTNLNLPFETRTDVYGILKLPDNLHEIKSSRKPRGMLN